MNKHIPKTLICLGAVALLAAACGSPRETRPVAVVVPQEPQSILVTEAPPPPRSEAPGVAPDEAYTWVSGYWGRMNERWVWIPGHWERTRPGAVWAAGRWEQTDKGWAWIPGRWEPTPAPPSSVGGAEEP
jgi:hypothetical protein